MGNVRLKSEEGETEKSAYKVLSSSNRTWPIIASMHMSKTVEHRNVHMRPDRFKDMEALKKRLEEKIAARFRTGM
jgi:uncharacterized protein YueI